MNFYHILFALKQGFNRNLTWYENLFVRFYNNTIAKLVAKILRIKGNTVSFNQLVNPLSFANGSRNSVTGTNNNDGSYTINGTASATGEFQIYGYMPVILNHKYYVKNSGLTGGSEQTYYVQCWANNSAVNKGKDYGNGIIVEISTAYTQMNITLYFRFISGQVFNNRKIWPQVFDLTLMGIDNLTTTAEIESWLSSHIGDLPYFDYTKGTLIPFMGTGLKTTGKNLLDKNTIVQGSITGASTLSRCSTRGNKNIVVKNGDRLIISKTSSDIRFAVGVVDFNTDALLFDSGWLTASTTSYELNVTNYGYVYLGFSYTDDSNINPGIVKESNFQIEFGSTATAYEPYTSNTLSLPTLTYFPTGMKSAGSVYDELSDKAYARVGSIDLGTPTWTYDSNNKQFYSTVINDAKTGGWLLDLLCSIYPVANKSYDEMNMPHIRGMFDRRIYIIDENYSNNAQGLKTYLTGKYLNYELATPTETDISLDLTYPIQWGGTEQILPVNTSVPTTSGIVADIKYPDGTRYDQTFVYRVIEKVSQLGNRALSIMLGKKVETDNPEEPLEILLKGEK